MILSLSRQTEEFFDPAVILHRFNDCIEDIFPDAHIRLEKHYKVFAIVGEHPYAILKSQKSACSHLTAQAVSVSSTVLRYVEHDQPPAFVPSFAVLCRKCSLLFFKRNCPPASLGNLHSFLSVFLNKTHVAFDGKATCRCTGLKREFVAFLAHDSGV